MRPEVGGTRVLGPGAQQHAGGSGQQEQEQEANREQEPEADCQKGHRLKTPDEEGKSPALDPGGGVAWAPPY